METILKGLRDLEGVNGTFLADSSGQLYALNAESIYDASLLGQVSKAIANAIDSVKLLQDDWETITGQFSEGRLIIRNIPAGARKATAQFILVLIADARLNPSFATVAIRVAIGKLKAVLDANGGTLPAQATSPAAVVAPLQVTPAFAPSVPTAPVSSLTASAAASHATVVAPEVAGSGLSWSGLGSSSTMSASGVTVADAASSAALTACTKCLAKAVGPMAKVFVKDAVRKVAAGQPFARSMLPALVAELEKSVEDRDDAAAFRKAAAKIA